MAENRRNFLARATAGAAMLTLSGCSSLSQQKRVSDLLSDVEVLMRRAQRLFAGSHALAPEFSKANIAPAFRAHGTSIRHGGL